MKTLIVTLLLCFATTLAELTQDQKEMLIPFRNECAAELKIGLDVIQKALDSFMKEGKADLDDQLSCFSACMFKKIGFMTEEGKFDEDMVRAITGDAFPENKLDAAISGCKDQAGINECETAGKLVVCFAKHGMAVN